MRLVVGQACHSFQIHEEVHVFLHLKASIIMCSLLSVMHYTKISIKMSFNIEMAIYDRREH